MSWLAQNFTPMWIVWGIELSIIPIALVADLRYRLRHSSLSEEAGMNLFALLVIWIYASGFFLAPLATAYSSPTRADWWQMAAVRVAWQLGCAVLVGVGTVVAARANDRPLWAAWLFCAGVIVVGGLMCLSSLRDLIEGPLVIRGRPTFKVERTPSGRGGGSIFATLTLTSPDGSTHGFDVSGWGANRTEDQLAACERSPEVAVTLLRHVDAVLEVTCTPASR